MRRAEPPRGLQVFGRAGGHPAFALHRLQEHRADIGAMLGELALERRRVVVGQVRDAGGIGTEAGRILRLAAGRHREQRAPVERVDRRDDADLVRAVPVVRVAARELERRLVRFGAGIAEEHALGERRVDETLGEPQRRLIREPVGHVPELSRLLRQRLDERRMAMAERGHGHAAREVDVHPAILVPDARAFAAHRNERRRRVARHHPLVEHLARHGHRGGGARHGCATSWRDEAATTALAAEESGDMASPLGPDRARRDDLDLDAILGRGELGLDGRAGRRMARRPPTAPRRRSSRRSRRCRAGRSSPTGSSTCPSRLRRAARRSARAPAASDPRRPPSDRRRPAPRDTRCRTRDGSRVPKGVCRRAGVRWSCAFLAGACARARSVHCKPSRRGVRPVERVLDRVSTRDRRPLLPALRGALRTRARAEARPMSSR